jgi:hypothetical protein
MGNHPIWKLACFHGRKHAAELVPFDTPICKCMVYKP